MSVSAGSIEYSKLVSLQRARKAAWLLLVAVPLLTAVYVLQDASKPWVSWTPVAFTTSLADAAPPLFWLPEELGGVRHITLLGSIGNDTHQRPVLLHLLLKARYEGQELHLRGAGFAESASEHVCYYYCWHNMQPPEFSAWKDPEIMLQAATGTVYPFKLRLSESQKAPMRWWLLELVITAEQLTRDGDVFTLVVKGWPRFYGPICLSHWAGEMAAAASQEQNRTGDSATAAELVREVWVVSRPFFAVDPSAAADLFVRHVQHHLRMGFSGSVLYVRPDQFFKHFRQDARILQLIQEGWVRLVLWHSPYGFVSKEPQQRKPGNMHGRYWDENCIFQHALLSYYGMNAYLAIIDTDEYIVSFEPLRPIADLLVECLDNPAIAELYQFDTFLEENCSGPEVQKWRNENVSSLEHPLQRYKYMHLAPEHDSPEIGASVSMKSIAAPEYTYSYFTHHGYSSVVVGSNSGLVRNRTETWACGFAFLHLKNLWSCRVRHQAKWGKQTGAQNESSWQWLYE